MPTDNSPNYDELLKAVAELGYEDGDPAYNVRRYKKYATGEIERLRKGAKRLEAYTQKLQEMLKPEQFLPIAREMIGEIVGAQSNNVK